MEVERNWLHPSGIAGRPWYRHLLYACRNTYAHLELPGLTEAVESGDASLTRQQAAVLESALRVNAELVNQLNLELACGGNVIDRGMALCPAPDHSPSNVPLFSGLRPRAFKMAVASPGLRLRDDDFGIDDLVSPRLQPGDKFGSARETVSTVSWWRAENHRNGFQSGGGPTPS